MEDNEGMLYAAIRELFEETSILLSADNVAVFGHYNIQNDDMCFEYTVFLHDCTARPNVVIDDSTHTFFGWFTLTDALRLSLVPQLAPILRAAFIADQRKDESFVAQGRDTLRGDSLQTLDREVRQETSAQFLKPQFTQVKTWHVSFGPPGAGKSTTLQEMQRQNQKLSLVADNAILRPSSRLHYYLTAAFQYGNKLCFFPFQMDVLAMRWQQAFAAPDMSLVDETIFSTLAYSRALYYLRWISKYEYQTFLVHYLHYRYLLPPPTRILHFTCERSTLKLRIRDRPDSNNRTWESFFTEEYLEALEYAFAEVASELKAEFTVVSIDTTERSTLDIVREYGA